MTINQKTKIIYFDHWSAASEYYRLMPLDYITHPDFTITRSTEREIKSHLLNNYDIIVLSRPSSDAHLNLIKLAKDLHMKVIADYDDDLLHVPETNPLFEMYKNEKANSIRCITLADEVWVATEATKTSFKTYNKNITVIPNSWNEIVFPIDQKPPFGKERKAMYRGGSSHEHDILMPHTAEWIVKLINNNKSWDFYWLGERYKWIEYRIKHKNYFHSYGASCVQFYKMMQKINPKVFFYPLANDLFNRSKSNCSWLESTFAGAAYFGKKELPEFNKEFILPIADMPYLMKQDDVLKLAHDNSFQYICDCLTLETINKLRTRRVEKLL